MAVSAVNSSSGSYVTDGTTAVGTRVPKQTLDASDFMKLLAVQMQNQDPTSPMDNSQQLAQMAQMSSMQGMAQIVQNFAQISSSQTQVLANSYLGRQVTLTDNAGDTITGDVTAIDASGTAPQLQVNGNYYPLSSITRVELPPAPTTPSPTT